MIRTPPPAARSGTKCPDRGGHEHPIPGICNTLFGNRKEHEIDDLTRPEVHQLLEEHLSNMYEWTPADRVFALDLEKLRVPEITFWTAWDVNTLLGCGALKQLSLVHGEIKSMRTPRVSRRQGAGRATQANGA